MFLLRGLAKLVSPSMLEVRGKKDLMKIIREQFWHSGVCRYILFARLEDVEKGLSTSWISYQLLSEDAIW